jgi:AdoMet-dependent heme synthase
MSSRTSHPFDHKPFIVFWELTRACDLVCQHCRACALPDRDPLELTTEEGEALLSEVRAMGTPLVVLTGGDPAKRPDLVHLVRFGTSLGLRMALTPSATPLVTHELLAELKDAGLSRLAVSIDGVRRGQHDAFRGVQGSYGQALSILTTARSLGITTQVNTTLTPHNVQDLERFAEMLTRLDIELWGVFLLVPTGRGEQLEGLEPDTVEAMLTKLAELAERVPFDIKTTAAPHFRRILLTRKQRRAVIVGVSDGIGRAPQGVNDGQGIVFVSHQGEINPSGFLPISCGNVRTSRLADVYRSHPLMRSLRAPDELKGKCGVCEFRHVCGVSRARAHAVHGDPLAEEPSCAYIPKSMRAEQSRERGELA